VTVYYNAVLRFGPDVACGLCISRVVQRLHIKYATTQGSVERSENEPERHAAAQDRLLEEFRHILVKLEQCNALVAYRDGQVDGSTKKELKRYEKELEGCKRGNDLERFKIELERCKKEYVQNLEDWEKRLKSSKMRCESYREQSKELDHVRERLLHCYGQLASHDQRVHALTKKLTGMGLWMKLSSRCEGAD
jgi:hypothetical protein